MGAPFSKLSPEIVGRVLFFLPTPCLLQMAYVCSTFRDVSKIELRGRINEHVGKHVKDPQSFFDIIGSASAIISGSTALAVIACGTTRDNLKNWQAKSDLDIYVPSEVAESAICQWLRIHDGYETVAVAERDLEKYWEEPACISSVIRLKSPHYNTHIDVVRAQANVAALPVVAFWGTLVMNFITSTRLVVLYPRFTLAVIGVLNPHSTRIEASRAVPAGPTSEGSAKVQ